MRYIASTFFDGCASMAMVTGFSLSMAGTDGDAVKFGTPSAICDVDEFGEMAELAEGARLLSECAV
jgi:hypothetical protein